MAVRLSTMAQVKALSLASLIRKPGKAGGVSIGDQITNNDIDSAVNTLNTEITNSFSRGSGSSTLFTSVGLARNLRIDEDFGTQNIYGIGSPTRPRPIPNNYSVNISIDRLQLDKRDTSHYITSPEYFYSEIVQRSIGINDWLLYSYIYVKSQEDKAEDGLAGLPGKLYAVMPRSSSKPVSSGEVMIVNSVQMVGFAVTFPQLAEELIGSLAEFSLTGDLDVAAERIGGV